MKYLTLFGVATLRIEAGRYQIKASNPTYCRAPNGRQELGSMLWGHRWEAGPTTSSLPPLWFWLIPHQYLLLERAVHYYRSVWHLWPYWQRDPCDDTSIRHLEDLLPPSEFIFEFLTIGQWMSCDYEFNAWTKKMVIGFGSLRSGSDGLPSEIWDFGVWLCVFRIKNLINRSNTRA